MSFQIDAVLEQRERVDADEAWFSLEGRTFGPEGLYPLKILVGTGGEAWNNGFTEGTQAYSDKLAPAKRRKFAQNCMNPATMDRPSLIMATRKAINASGALKKVAWCGPTFDSERELDAWINGDTTIDVYGHEQKAPKDAKVFYEEQPDGTWCVPLHKTPPVEWLASDSDVFKLKADSDFLLQVGTSRRRLDEEGQESEAADLGNSESGLDTSSISSPSPKESAPASKKSEVAAST